MDLLHDLNDYTLNVAEPFFKKWSDLRVLDKFLDTVPQMEIENFVSNGVFSKALVYKLCNNPKFEEYFNLLYDYYVTDYEINKESNDPIAYEQGFNFIIAFKEVLDKTEPIYNI